MFISQMTIVMKKQTQTSKITKYQVTQVLISQKH